MEFDVIDPCTTNEVVDIEIIFLDSLYAEITGDILFEGKTGQYTFRVQVNVKLGAAYTSICGPADVVIWDGT